jgi:hypothetical protein
MTSRCVALTPSRRRRVLALMHSPPCATHACPRASQHPGTTNAYQVNTGSALALRYNDASVLENHHCSVGFAVMDRSGILKGLDGADVKALRKLFVAAVLATDMSVHKDLLARVAARAVPEPGAGGAPAAELPPGVTAAGGGFSRDSSDDRQLLISFLLHSADLCNPLFPPPMSRRIASELALEFSRQAELERQQGLPITVMVAADDVAQAKVRCVHARVFMRARACACAPLTSPFFSYCLQAELGFITFVVQPLYATLAKISPVLGAKCMSLIDENRAAWNAVIAANADNVSSRSRNSGK